MREMKIDVCIWEWDRWGVPDTYRLRIEQYHAHIGSRQESRFDHW
jgi:hypothetical protein